MECNGIIAMSVALGSVECVQEILYRDGTLTGRYRNTTNQNKNTTSVSIYCTLLSFTVHKI